MQYDRPLLNQLFYSGMLLDQHLFATLSQAAAASPRRRAFHNLHQDYAEPVQRVLIALLPDSYVAPHRHSQPSQWELFVVLSGRVDFIQFNEDGQVVSRHQLVAGSSLSGLQLAPGCWHSVTAPAGPAFFLEVKQGPYDPSQPRESAGFAPAEQTAQAASYLSWLQQATVGSCYQEERI